MSRFVTAQGCGTGPLSLQGSRRFEANDVGGAESPLYCRQPVSTIHKLDPPSRGITIERATRRVLALGFLDFRKLVERTPFGPRSFPITGLADLPLAERDLVLEVLGREPVRHWLDISTVEQLPDSPFAVTHLEPLPSELARLVA